MKKLNVTFVSFVLILFVSLMASGNLPEIKEMVIVGEITDGDSSCDHLYSFREGTEYKVKLEVPDGNDFDLYIYEGFPLEDVKATYKSERVMSKDEIITFKSVADGINFIRVKSYNGSTGLYKILITKMTKYNPSGSFTPFLKRGELVESDDFDLYQFSLNRFTNISLILQDPDYSDFDLYVYAANQNEFGLGEIIASSKESHRYDSLNFFAPLSKGTYNVLVKSHKGSGEYTLIGMYDEK